MYLGFSVDDGDTEAEPFGVGRGSAGGQRVLGDDDRVAVVRNLANR